MADYGFSALNDSSSVIISNKYKVMVFSERGQFSITSQYSDKEGHGTVVFVRPILTQEPPQIFVRHISGSHASLGVYTTMSGGPGNWTGFLITSAVRAGNILQNYSMEYVSCKFADQPSREVYGMNIKDENRQMVFSSADKIVSYSKFAKNWTVEKGSVVDIYSSNLAIDADDFICVSSMDRGVMWFADGVQFAGLTLLENSLPVLRINAQIAGGGYWYYQGVNGTCFGIPVCKFPVSRYYN
ncbi:hypothetical protein NLO85_28005 [Pseudomonas savastanoi]|uniref:Uncharacterized protein n=1 Tax=Pseudomonas savastanoi TaxID=29438 RepID=A0AAW5JCP8_PSESS|nr:MULTISPECIES: hypothetical protein [Pseudomonas]KAA3544262.1 hypothetical protein DXU85_14190 [Pseudomonas savastanoi]MCQ3024258.1 hypothetical protein [Pseudomonas savastanoi]RML71763.1 hypothetical protein ALQ90_101118 [Pseudomonas savastanoi pv. savastanoi]TSC36776.1 hypothetical protein FOM00_12085 [Pseudomonas sp. ST1]UKL12310.1 hypothetical protein HQ966_13565 [Pseudomonas savastanoi pv. savastanoi]